MALAAVFWFYDIYFAFGMLLHDLVEISWKNPGLRIKSIFLHSFRVYFWVVDPEKVESNRQLILPSNLRDFRDMVNFGGGLLLLDFASSQRMISPK